MICNITPLILTAIAFAGFFGESRAQERADVPVAKLHVALPQALRSAELHFTPDGSKLLVLRHYSNKIEPLLTVHNVARNPKGFTTGYELHNPLVGSDLFGKLELARDSYGKSHPTWRKEGVTATLSPNGKLFLTSSFHTLRLWETSTGKPWGPALEHPGSVKAAFSSDGKRLLTATLLGGKAAQDPVQYQVRLWEAESGNPIGEPATGMAPRISGHDPYMKALLWTPDEKAFVMGYSHWNSEASFLQFWDAQAMKPVGEPLPAYGDFQQFSRDGKTLLVISEQEMTRWDVVNRKPLSNLTIAKSLKGGASRRPDLKSWFAVHPEGTDVLFRTRGKGGSGDQVQLWDLSGDMPRQKQVLELGKAEQVQHVAMSRDGKLAATAGVGPVLVWNLETGRPLLKIPLAPATFTDSWGQHDGGLKAMAFSPDGRLLAVVDGMGVRLWQVDTKR